MKWSRVLIAAALVVLVAACGSSTPKTTTPPAARASASPAQTPAPNLSSELLAITDLPAGWSAVPSTGSSSSTPKCLNNVKTDLNPATKAEATFVGGSNGLPALDEYLAYLPGQGPAAMAAIARVLAGCGQLSTTSGGQTLTGTIGAMSFPAIADQSSAYQINLSGTISGVSVTLGIDLIVFRKADTIGMILYGDLGTPDVSALEPLVQTAAAKLS